MGLRGPHATSQLRRTQPAPKLHVTHTLICWECRATFQSKRIDAQFCSNSASRTGIDAENQAGRRPSSKCGDNDEAGSSFVHRGIWIPSGRSGSVEQVAFRGAISMKTHGHTFARSRSSLIAFLVLAVTIVAGFVESRRKRGQFPLNSICR